MARFTIYPVQVEASEGGVVEQFLFDFRPNNGGPANIVGVFTKDKEGIPIIKPSLMAIHGKEVGNGPHRCVFSGC